MSTLRQGVVRVARTALTLPLLGPGLMAMVRLLGQRTATVFMLHRLRDPKLGNEGDDPVVLRESLALLRAQGVAFLSLRGLMERVAERRPLDGPTAVFTVDDSYLDFGSITAPIFAEFGCPVTAFVTTDVAAGDLWFWWDRFEHALVESPREAIEVPAGGRTHRIVLGDRAARLAAAERLVEQVKWLDDGERQRLADGIGTLAGVDLPATPPPRYRVLDWNQIRALEQRGVEFGPHSKRHPIMSRVDDATARDEIDGSWAALKRECRDPVPVFCYPNGTPESFSARDMKYVEQAGMLGALTFQRRRLQPQRVSGDERFRLPRVEWPADRHRVALIAAGLLPLRPV